MPLDPASPMIPDRAAPPATAEGRVDLPEGVSDRMKAMAEEIRAAGAGDAVATYYGAMHDAITAYAATLAGRTAAVGVAPELASRLLRLYRVWGDVPHELPIELEEALAAVEIAAPSDALAAAPQPRPAPEGSAPGAGLAGVESDALLVLSSERADEAYTAMLARPDFRPQRMHLEGARNAIRTATEAARRMEARLRDLAAAPADVARAVPPELRRLSEAATPGLWCQGNYANAVKDRYGDLLLATSSERRAMAEAVANAALIAAAVNDLRSRIAAEDRASPAGGQGGEGA